MPRTACYLLQFIAYCMLSGVAFAIKGPNVRSSSPHEFNYVVSLSMRPRHHYVISGSFENHHFCTGTLITRKNVITAAHCLLRRHPSQIEIIAGSTDLRNGNKYYPESWITYDEWRDGQTSEHSPHDIGMIILADEGVNRSITPASLSFGPTRTLYNKKIRLAGWGVTAAGNKPRVIRSAGLIAIPNEECIEKSTNLLTRLNRTFSLPANHFCSLAEPWALSTSGDDGAPLLNKTRELVGINLGVTPNLEESPYTEEFLNENQLNDHLSLPHYRDFIMQISR